MVDLGTIRGRVVLDIKQAVASYAALRANNARTVYALRGTGESFTQAGKTMTVAGAGMVYAFGKVVMAAADFERKMDFAAAVSGTTGKEMQKLSDYALQLGQDTIYSAGEIADGFIELAKAGVTAKQIIGGIGEAMTNLGAAGDIPLAESGQIITSTVQQFDLAAKDAIRVTDLLAGAANASIADITDIGVSLKYVGGVANAAGLSLEDTTTAISLLAKAGIRGSTAGTSLRQMIVSFGGATGPARDALKEIGILTEDGSNKFYDMQGNLKPLNEVFQTLQDHTEKYTNKQRLMYLRTIFNNRALSAASILTRDGAKGFKQMNREMSKTTAADVAAARLDNLSGDLEILRGNIETIMIKAGTPFQEVLRGWVQNITRLVQAFGDLDPETQKMITQTVGMGGAMLVAMGLFTWAIGIIFRFVAAMIKMGAGLKFLGRLLKIVGVNSKWAARLIIGPLLTALGAVGGLVAIIVVAVLAFIAVWILAYKKIEPFRKAVDAWYGAIWKALKAFGAFLELLARDPGKAWEDIKDGASDLADYLVEWFQTKLPELIKQGVELAAEYVGKFVDDVVSYLSRLPGEALAIISSFVGEVLSYFTFENLGTVVGVMIGLLIQAFVRLRVLAIQALLGLVTGAVGLFAMLAPKAAYLIGYMIGWIIRQMINFATWMNSTIARIVMGLIGWFARLPGRVAGFIGRMVAMGISHMIRFAASLPALAGRAARGIVNFLQALPGTVIRLFQRLYNGARNLMSQLPGMMRQFASGAKNGLVRTLEGLPGIVSGILGKVIAAFTGVIGQAYEAAKGVGGGLWEGFKDGIGMNSPSYIEKAAWQVNDTLDKETKRMAKTTMNIQKLSKGMVNSQLRKVGDKKTIVPEGRERIERLASMHARNQNRARNLITSSAQTPRKRSNIKPPPSKRRGPVPISGRLRLDNAGAYIEGFAEGIVNEEEDFYDTVGRMG